MRYVRLFAGPDGESHFQDIAVELTPIAEYAKGVPLVYISASRASTALTFLSAPPGFFGDWHAAPRQQFMIKLAGETEFVASDGERRQIGPGTVLLIEDTSGKGHTSRVLGPRRRRVVRRWPRRTRAELGGTYRPCRTALESLLKRAPLDWPRLPRQLRRGASSGRSVRTAG